MGGDAGTGERDQEPASQQHRRAVPQLPRHDAAEHRPRAEHGRRRLAHRQPGPDRRRCARRRSRRRAGPAARPARRLREPDRTPVQRPHRLLGDAVGSVGLQHLLRAGRHQLARPGGVGQHGAPGRRLHVRASQHGGHAALDAHALADDAERGAVQRDAVVLRRDLFEPRAAVGAAAPLGEPAGRHREPARQLRPRHRAGRLLPDDVQLPRHADEGHQHARAEDRRRRHLRAEQRQGAVGRDAGISLQQPVELRQ